MVRWLSKISLIFLSVGLTACDSQVSDFIKSAHRGLGSTGSFSPDASPIPTNPITSLTISTDRPLIASAYNLTVAPYANPAVTPSLGGAALTVSPASNVSSAVASSASGVATTTSIINPTVNLATNYDGTVAFTANLGFANAPSDSTFSACTFLGVYSGIACVASASFQLLSTQILSGSLSINSGGVASNSLSSTKIQIKRVADSNMISSASSNISCGGQFMYTGVAVGPNASRSFIYNPAANTFRQEFSTRGASNDGPVTGVCYNNRYIYFFSSNSNNRQKLFKYDTQTATISQITNLLANQNSAELAGSLTQANGKIYFWAYNASSAIKLIELDPSTDTAKQISDIGNNAAVSDSMANGVVEITTAGSRYFLNTYSSIMGGELYEFDPTGNSITLRADTNSGGGDNIANLKYYGDSLYFSASIANNVNKLMRYKLSNNTITQISNTSGNAATNDGFIGMMGPSIYTYFNGKVYFQSKNAAGYMKMFVYNPADDSVVQISNTAGSSASDFFGSFKEFNGKLYFYGANTNGKTKLFRMNATGDAIEQISNITGNQNTDDSPNYLNVYNGRLYFSAVIASGVYKLFVYDEPTHSIVQVSNTSESAAATDNISDFMFGANLMTFVGNTTGVARAVFALCDSSAGCTLP